jgi:hypothetical protein
VTTERYRVTLEGQRAEVGAPDAHCALCLVASRMRRYRNADLRLLEGVVLDERENVLGSVQFAT